MIAFPSGSRSLVKTLPLTGVSSTPVISSLTAIGHAFLSPPPPLPAAAMMPPITAPPPIIHGSKDPPAALAGNKTSSPGIPLKPETPSNQYKIQPSSSKTRSESTLSYTTKKFSIRTVSPLFNFKIRLLPSRKNSATSLRCILVWTIDASVKVICCVLIDTLFKESFSTTIKFVMFCVAYIR
ncbi:Uncharacterised protein [Klebsiella quasipneumoniae]|nr:Uncharacterised protein [Klebsiella quasipneumoniae]VVZ93052.1 Uncharacterised protein [Escherichia coli]